MIKKDILLFDLDGTLIDSAPGILNCIKYALSFYDIEETDPAVLNSFLGPPLYYMFMSRYGFTPEQSAEAVEHYRDRFRTKGILENSLYPDVKKMLGIFKERGKTLFLATSKPIPFATRIIERLEILPFFDFIGGGDMSGNRSKKEDILRYIIDENAFSEEDKKKIVMIGDRSVDVTGAAQMGIETVGALYGYGSREELEEAGAVAIAESVMDLTNIII